MRCSGYDLRVFNAQYKDTGEYRANIIGVGESLAVIVSVNGYPTATSDGAGRVLYITLLYTSSGHSMIFPILVPIVVTSSPMTSTTETNESTERPSTQPGAHDPGV